MSEEKIIKKLIEHGEQLEEIKQEMATKADIREVRGVLDKAMTILRRLDQERIFTVEWIY